MAFDLEIPEPEEVKEKVKQELAVPDDHAKAISNMSEKKGEEILDRFPSNTDLIEEKLLDTLSSEEKEELKRMLLILHKNVQS